MGWKAARSLETMCADHWRWREQQSRWILLIVTTEGTAADADIVRHARAMIKSGCRFSLRAAPPFQAELHTSWYLLLKGHTSRLILLVDRTT